ncbi:MAG: hypothetical protein HY282_17980 [Nitrospirae bacterium]|nr:hypothetical protein [Candidatus Manganitrophaceae bacterium]
MQTPHNYVPVLFASLLQPIVDLFDHMEKKEPKGPNEVQASKHENGYAASIAVLTVIVIESVCNRARHVYGLVDRNGAVQTLRELQAGGLADDVEELFVLRDVIAHNHIWEAIAEDDTTGLTLVSATKHPSYGDAKFNRTVDLEIRQTRRLHLDIFPARIHRQTAIVVLQKCVEVLRFLENSDTRLVGSTDPHIIWKSRPVAFYQWVDEL